MSKNFTLSLISLLILVFSCGYEDKETVEVIYKDKETEKEEVKQAEDKEQIEDKSQWVAMKKVLADNCMSCHATQNPVMATEDQFNAVKDSAKAAVASGKMPIGKSMSQADKDFFAAYD